MSPPTPDEPLPAADGGVPLKRATRRLAVEALERVGTLSCFELRSLFVRAGFERIRLELPAITGSDLSRLGRLGGLLGRIYNRTRRLPLARQLFMLFGPFFQIVARRGRG